MFNANDYNPSAGNYVSKIINPGTHILRILDIEFDIPSYDPSALSLVFLCETQPVGGEFEGLDVDKNNPSKGKYQGQIGKIKSGRYPFSEYKFQDRTSGSEKVVERDPQIFNWLMKMATQLNIFDQIKNSGIQSSEITDYINKIKPFFIGKWAMFTVAGQEYFTEGYTSANYRLFFPKPDYKKQLFPISALKDAEGKVIKLLPFNEAEHIVPAKKEDAQANENVTGFSPNPSGFNPAPPAPAQMPMSSAPAAPQPQK